MVGAQEFNSWAQDLNGWAPGIRLCSGPGNQWLGALDSGCGVGYRAADGRSWGGALLISWAPAIGSLGPSTIGFQGTSR